MRTYLQAPFLYLASS